ncbi:MAG: TrbG/VirB9 family P-type conjugative transfer protein [Rickettsiales bacterium]|jgi:type IV secretory pathway VirB9-like protein|nr:TrbG/VirB9 family P-type conjugative transfer protein [Rickettsiales bacterium]
MTRLFLAFALAAWCVLIAPGAGSANTNFGVQAAWDNPDANMAPGSVKPGYAQLTWSPGTILTIRLRAGMVTMINLPEGEEIASAAVGSEGLFEFPEGNLAGKRSILISPVAGNQGSDTNLIVLGKSGNKYIFYLRSEPANSSEITYSQVDISIEGQRGSLNASSANGGATSLTNRSSRSNTAVSFDGEDYGWIKSMKIDPSEFRFDLDIFVPNPDDYVIAPERVWRDRIFTYIDFGDKVIAMTQRPVVSVLIEGGESPVGFRTDGPDGRLLIVEAVGDMVLRSGQRLVCIRKRAKPFLISNSASVMALAEANVASRMNAGTSFNQSVYGGVSMGGVPGDAWGGGFADQSWQMGAAPVNMMYGDPAAMMGAGGGSNNIFLPGGGSAPRVTAGAYLPNRDIPIVSSNQKGVAVELQADTSVKALNEYWNKLLARFSSDDKGQGILAPYASKVFFAVDEQGVGSLGSGSATGRLYRLRIGPMNSIDEAQSLCNQLAKFQGTACNVVRIQ